jgi:osmoprotectant transport system substrate-binding protein
MSRPVAKTMLQRSSRSFSLSKQSLVVLLPFLFSCSACSRERPIVVGSKNFTEQVLLGEIAARHIENRLHVKVDRKLNLGGTLLAHEALVSGALDLYPEYTGTALTAILKKPPSADAARVLDIVRTEYGRRWKLEWLAPLGFNDTFAMVVRGDLARRDKLVTLSDASVRPSGWTLGVGYEFAQRPDGLAGLTATYGLRLRGAPKTMDLGLLYKALEQGEVDMVAANATDGLLAARDFVVLRDDRRYFPPYEAAFVVRSEALTAHPGLGEALAELSGRLPDQKMQSLNNQVDDAHRRVTEVAEEFLRRENLFQ